MAHNGIINTVDTMPSESHRHSSLKFTNTGEVMREIPDENPPSVEPEWPLSGTNQVEFPWYSYFVLRT